MQAMPFQRLLKPPQSMAARSMPTPQQSPCSDCRGKISRCIKSSLHARAPVRSEWVLLCSISTVQRVGQPVPFLKLLKPPQSTASRSMPTPKQSPLQRLQRGNLLLHKIVTACKSTRSPRMGAALFYVSISIVR